MDILYFCRRLVGKRRKILFVFCSKVVIDQLVANKVSEKDLDDTFFGSKAWPARPNSTVRLNVANYMALTRLRKNFDIDFLCTEELNDALIDALQTKDIVVINQVASSLRFIGALKEHIATNKPRAKIIFGTEFSWYNKLAAGEIGSDIIDEVYCRHVLLRHTARTETPLYADLPRLRSSVIQEFQLGVDTDVVRYGEPVSHRKLISFVRAPEGRTIKNNQLIEVIVQRVEKSPVLRNFKIKVISPPYNSSEYWRTMRDSMFFVFTSNGETFSYCLHDAKASGAICFHPSHTFLNVVDSRFAIESYPFSGEKYSTVDQLIEKLEFFAENPAEAQLASERERKYVVDNFSIASLARSWSRLLSGQNLNTESLLIFDCRERFDKEKIVRACHKLGARYAVPYLNCTAFLDDDHFSKVLAEDVALIKYFITLRDGVARRTLCMKEGRPYFGEGDPTQESLTDTVGFLQLLCRTAKIGRIFLDRQINSPILFDALNSIRFFYSLRRGNIQVPYTTVRV